MSKNNPKDLDNLLSQLQFAKDSQNNLSKEHLDIKMNLKGQLSKAIEVEDTKLSQLIEEKYQKASILTLERASLIKKAIDDTTQELSLFSHNKKISTSIIIQNELGQILLLKRSSKDSFHPNTWCLPGGGMDLDSPFSEAEREVKEETNLVLNQIHYLSLYDLENITLIYFMSNVLSTQVITLYDEEHSQYAWVNLNDIFEFDLILDLKSHLVDLLGLQDNNIRFSELQVIKKAFEAGALDSDTFNKIIEIDLVKGGYPIGHKKSYTDGSTWRKVKDTNGIGDWVKILQDDVVKEINTKLDESVVEDDKNIVVNVEEVEVEINNEIVEENLEPEPIVEGVGNVEDFAELFSIIPALEKNEFNKILLSNSLNKFCPSDRELAEKWLEDYLNNWDSYNN